MATRINRLRNLISATLSVYSIGCFIAGMTFAEQWGSAAPDTPNPALGLVVPYHHHTAIRYFSAFQSTYAHLLLTAWWLFIVALIVIPKRNIEVAWLGPLPLGWGGDEDDPDRMGPWGAALGAALVAATLAGLGPLLVHWLNAQGVVLRA